MRSAPNQGSGQRIRTTPLTSASLTLTNILVIIASSQHGIVGDLLAPRCESTRVDKEVYVTFRIHRNAWRCGDMWRCSDGAAAHGGDAAWRWRCGSQLDSTYLVTAHTLQLHPFHVGGGERHVVVNHLQQQRARSVVLWRGGEERDFNGQNCNLHKTHIYEIKPSQHTDQ